MRAGMMRTEAQRKKMWKQLHYWEGERSKNLAQSLS
jgi:hypothetical protein